MMMLKMMLVVMVCLVPLIKGADQNVVEDMIKEIKEIKENVKKESTKIKEMADEENVKKEGQVKEMNDERGFRFKGKGPKICLDRRGDCKSVLHYCPTLKGLCDKSCGFCKGILGHQDTFVFGLEEIELKKNNFISRIPFMGREFEVSFDLLPTVFGTGVRNLIHFSVTNRNVAVRGDRIPGVWLSSSNPSADKNSLYICSDVNGNKNYCYTTNKFIEKNRWVKIILRQFHVFGGYYYSITVDGHVIHTLKNKAPASYKHVYVYGGDPWHNAAEGTIRNLVIKTSM
jgi:hypothetical protein